MKKIYLNPTVEIIEVAVEAGIAASSLLEPGDASLDGLYEEEQI